MVKRQSEEAMIHEIIEIVEAAVFSLCFRLRSAENSVYSHGIEPFADRLIFPFVARLRRNQSDSRNLWYAGDDQQIHHQCGGDEFPEQFSS